LRQLLKISVPAWYLLVGVLIIITGTIFETALPNWRLQQPHMHSTIESIGAFSAFVTAILILRMRSGNDMSNRYICIASAFIVMGLYDVFHAVLPPGNWYVWGHSLSTFFGGLFFSYVWLCRNPLKLILYKKLIFLTLCAAAVMAVVFFLSSSVLPLMIDNNEFTNLAIALNITGSIGFFAAAGYFIKQNIDVELINATAKRRLFLSFFVLLFATAGLFYLFSAPWDASWWFWHVLRMLGHMIAAVYFFSLFSYAGKQTEIAQKQLHDAIDAISEGFVLYDKDGNLVICNQKFKDFYKYSDDEATPGVHRTVLGEIDIRRPQVVLGNIDGDTYINRREALTLGSPLSMTIQLKNNHILDIKDYITESGEVVSIQTDITDQKKAEDTAFIAKIDAEKANRAKSEFLASMSHELRTPLNAVLGFAQLLQIDSKSPLTSNQEQNVDCIVQGGQHLLKLVNEILDLAKIEANQSELTFENVIANDVIADCVTMIRPLGEQNNIVITNQLRRAPSQTVRVDRMRLKQIIINLLSNAIKFNKTGGTVTINGTVTDQNNLRISVTDTGHGIAEEDFANVFKMFQRLHDNSMIAREGTGIGLTVSKLLVERMSGRTGFYSELGSGSTFWIEFQRF